MFKTEKEEDVWKNIELNISLFFVLFLFCILKFYQH